MKKSVYYCFLPALFLCGCNVLEPEVSTLESKHFEAITESYNPETKTSLDQNGNILWTKGDQISVFAGSTINEQYQVSDASDGQTSAKVDPVSPSGFSAGGTIDNNVAFYPYSSTATIEKSGSNYVLGNISLPSTQSYSADSFGNGAFPMAAVTSSTTDMNLKFKNTLGGLKLQLTGTATISSISISGNNSEILCGAANVTVSTSDIPAISLTDATATTVTLNCGDGVQLNSTTPTSFVIALPAMTMSGGFTVTVIDTDGKQMEIKTTKSQTIKRSSLLKMPEVEYVGTGEVGPDPNLSKPLTFTSSGNTSVSLNAVGSPYSVALEYRKGSNDWSSYAIGTEVVLSDGETVQFKATSGGNTLFSKGSTNYYKFVLSGEGTVAASGNIMSLLDESLQKTTLKEYEFLNLFRDCTRLTIAPVLPATSMANSCYTGMFSGCTSLTIAPALPATTLATYCYNGMFQDCTSLTTAPALPATTLPMHCYEGMFIRCTNLTAVPETIPATTAQSKCCSEMFSGCTSLTVAPQLTATTVATDCYGLMFNGCASLITAPAVLPATSLASASGCYSGMFSGCTSLTTAPELPATTLASSCYSNMFYGCTSLATAPELPATNLVSNCYYQMFRNCSSLSYVKCLAKNPSINYCDFWLDGVSATGRFYKCAGVSWARADYGIPEGWGVETD